MLTITVADVAMRLRSVAVPEHCPRCQQPLRVAGKVWLKPLWATPRFTAIPEKDHTHGVVGTAVHEAQPSEWLCGHCGGSVVHGAVSVKPAKEE